MSDLAKIILIEVCNEKMPLRDYLELQAAFAPALSSSIV